MRYAIIAFLSCVFVVLLVVFVKKEKPKKDVSSEIKKSIDSSIHDTVDVNSIMLQQKIDSFKIRIARERIKRKEDS